MSNTLFSIGVNALLSNQAAITIVGDNVSNQGVEGYHRKIARFSELNTVNTGYGAVGTGVTVAIARAANYLVEAQYLNENSLSTASQTLYNQLSITESLFSMDENFGLSALLDNYWSAWEALAADPSELTLRTTLISSAQSLSAAIQETYDSLVSQQQDLNKEIKEQVGELNDLLTQLAVINGKVVGATDNTNLLDERDDLIRQISEYIDVNVIYDDNNQVTLLTQEGQTLVTENEAFYFAFESAQSFTSLEPTSDFDGQIYYSGSSDAEVTLEAVTSGAASTLASGATFKVSLDGGSTWLKDENGDVRTWQIGGIDDSVTIDGVEIWFGTENSASTTPSTDFTAGDTFNVVAKNGLYWYQTAASKVNVTPLESSNDNRLTGGTLTGLLQARDSAIGSYKDALDALSSSLIWEVNSLHSQGSGLNPLSTITGENAVDDETAALDSSGLEFEDKLQEGVISLALFDATSGDPQGVTAIDFSSVTPGQSTFDPSVHSLQDVVDAINASMGGDVTASIVNGRLKMDTTSSVDFEIADDTTGVFAALGVNTFFSGSDASNITVSTSITTDSDRICAGHVNGEGEANSGDNTTANLIADLATSAVDISTAAKTTTSTLSEYLSNLVALVGSDTATAKSDYEYKESLATTLETMQEEISGVNLDEELALLVRYQQAYTAASKLITASTEMIDTVLGMAP